MITIILCCRIDGNINSNLPFLLDSINKTISDPDNIEILLKFDDDDKDAPDCIQLISSRNYPFLISHVITPRGQGYYDLHKSNNDAFMRSSISSKLYWAISDDVEFKVNDWDKIIFSAYEEGIKKFGTKKLFVLHQDDVFIGRNLEYNEVLERNEAWPIWTSEWLETIGSIGMTVATDAWTSCIEATLSTQYGLDPRVILPTKLIYRSVSKEDMTGYRWDVQRRKIIADLKSPRLRKIIEAQAENIFIKSEFYKKFTRPFFNFIDPEKTLEQIFFIYGNDYLLHKSLTKCFGSNTSVEQQSLALAKFINRHVFPSFQKDGIYWNASIKYMLSEITEEVCKETSYDMALNWVRDICIEASNNLATKHNLTYSSKTLIDSNQSVALQTNPGTESADKKEENPKILLEQLINQHGVGKIIRKTLRLSFLKIFKHK